MIHGTVLAKLRVFKYMDLFKYNESDKCSFFTIKVSPNSQSDKIKYVIIYENQAILKINIKEKPVEGRANKAIIAFFSKTFKIAKRNFEFTSGLASKIKQIKVKNTDLTYLNQELFIVKN
jgi:uncharacterized protein (TIGR00251 family)